jgi:signal transduction histidine kinase
VLSERGLAAGVAALAERAVLPVELVELPSDRLPPAVEVAMYYVVSEALANAGKHSGASCVTVRVAVDGDVAAVEIVDDGAGGADPRGSGLRGLSDRVAALGGALVVSSEPGSGTALRAELPLG